MNAESLANEEAPVAIEVVLALGGGWHGNYGTARCPAHDDRAPSLSICERDGKLLVHCHAGCSQHDVLEALKSLGLWSRSPVATAPTPRSAPTSYSAARSSMARRIWEESRRAEGSPVERYLISRGIRHAVPRQLRFHPELRHPTGGTWPGMVALVSSSSDDVPTGIHRTFLGREGGKAQVMPVRMMLGRSLGSVVRLGTPGECTPLLIGEGIETCFAAMQATSYPAWAALSASGLAAVEVPPEVRAVVVLADGDVAGEQSAAKFACRNDRPGCSIKIAFAPRGQDFNDLLMEVA